MKFSIRISVLLACMLLTFNAKALINYGAEVAFTTSSVKITDIKNEFTDAVKGSGIKGYEAGFFFRVGLGPVYVKPKFLFEYQSGTLFYNTGGTEQSINFHAGKFLLPLLFGFNILPPVLSIEAGPVYNRLLSATKDFHGNRLDLEQGGLGYRIGLNAKLKMLNATISYQGIKNSGSAASTASYQTPDQLIFGLGIEF